MPEQDFISNGPDVTVGYACINPQCVGNPSGHCECPPVKAIFYTVYRDRWGNRYRSQFDACEPWVREGQMQYLFALGSFKHDA